MFKLGVSKLSAQSILTEYVATKVVALGPTAARLDRYNRPHALNRGTELSPERSELLRLYISWQRLNIETGLECPQTVWGERAEPDKRK